MNGKGCKSELAAPVFDSKRNYKCIRSIKITTAFVFASPVKNLGVTRSIIEMNYLTHSEI
jgi:hypothetical protein